MYLTVRGNSSETIDAEAVANTALRAPANLTPITPRWAQLETFLSGSAVGVDRLNDTTSLEFLETAVRHSRHYDLSLQFITQTGGEFALTPAARTIVNLCSITIIHRVKEEGEKFADWFGMSEREVNWVRTAKVGNDEDGYSEVLGIVGEGWFPFRRRSSGFEAEVISKGIADGNADPVKPLDTRIQNHRFIRII